MATLALTALGTAIGGPLGGAVGSLIGNQIDRSVIGGGRREGPRLKELAVTASSYGTPIPRHFGTMRAAGTVIWATDLVESSENAGGGEGAPATTTYSYSASFAVALASRPIIRLGRIWADGNLLRGTAGDLKVGGQLRIYPGHGDQDPDPLIASDRGPACPAFRGLAYCVFESLQLADFGNRVPALTFEIVADDGAITLAHLLEPLAGNVEGRSPLGGLVGLSDEGGAIADLLATVDQLFPLSCDAGGSRLTVQSPEEVPPGLPWLGAPAVDEAHEGPGAAGGRLRRRQAAADAVPQGLRYYDIARDYQASVQRVDGQAAPGRARMIEFPGTLEAANARGLIGRSARRAKSARDALSWRTAELDPALGPGSEIRVPGYSGAWRIEAWEWRENGVELELRRSEPRVPESVSADPGLVLAKSDLVAGPTRMVAFELPWSGQGTGETRQAYAAVSSASAGWTGAALYRVEGGDLVPIGTAGNRRATIGEAASPLASSPALILECAAWFDVALVSPDLELRGATAQQLAEGRNRAVLGEEIVQFATASRLGPVTWRLSGLLRGRGGTEAAASAGHAAGTPFALIDETLVTLDAGEIGTGEAVALAALGLADDAPVIAPLLNAGVTTRPLTPVHPRAERRNDGAVALAWTRRARGAWSWPDLVETPLNEESERYTVGLGPSAEPILLWDVTSPALELPGSIVAAHAGQPVWVRQVGRFASSLPLLLTILD